jgi:hypothetical protein
MLSYDMFQTMRFQHACPAYMLALCFSSPSQLDVSFLGVWGKGRGSQHAFQGPPHSQPHGGYCLHPRRIFTGDVVTVTVTDAEPLVARASWGGPREPALVC